MNKHKSEDYKLQAVKYYLRSKKSMDDVCEIFNCSKTSLYRWIERYKADKQIKRNSRKSISYKVKSKHVKYALELLKDNKHATMEYLVKKIKNKYKDFDITPQHLGKVIRDNILQEKEQNTNTIQKHDMVKKLILKEI